jgi:DNA polymerase-1
VLENKEYNLINKVPLTFCTGPQESKLHLINTMHEWRAFYELLMRQELVACDTETSGFHYFKKDRICGLSFGWDKTHFYIPVRHLDSVSGGAQPPQLCMDDLRDDLRAFFAQTDVFTIWHNWKFDAHFYRADGIEILTPYHDTRILLHFFNENAPGKLKVITSGWTDDLSRPQKGIVGPVADKAEKKIDKWRAEEARARRKEFSRLVMAKADELQKDPKYQSYGRRDLKKFISTELLHEHEYASAKKEDVHYGYIPIEMMYEYASLDTFLTWRLYEHIMQNMRMSKKLQSLYVNEIKLARVILETEEAGVKVDRGYLVDLHETYRITLADMEKDLVVAFGSINMDSNPQLARALLAAGVPLTKKTDSAKKCADCAQGVCQDHFCVDEKALKKFEHDYKIIHQLLEYRKVSKLQGTYVEGILNKLMEDNVLHCSFNQNVKTGRMSSSDPNLQNIPGRDKSIRRAFLAPDDDYIYVFFDYSQVELRLTTHYSQDPLLLDAYAKDQDVHTRTACEMFGHEYTDFLTALRDDKHVDHNKYAELRNIAKRINFGIIYGVGAPGLSEQIPRPDQYTLLPHKQWVDVCQAYINQYLDTYLLVKRFVNEGKRTVKRYSQVENSFGRIRHLPHAKATRILKDRSKYWLEARAGRQGVNFLIQGEAADLFKTAVVRVAELLKDKKTHIVNFVHDEIQVYLHKDEMYLLKEIKLLMEDFNDYTVPILVDIEYSTTNWAEKQEL